MRLTIALAALLALAGCATGGGGGGRTEPAGVALEARFSPEPLRAGRPATWLLAVTNRGEGPVVLTFRSGKNGDVALEQGGSEAYRWSAGKFFTQALRPVTLEAGKTETYALEEERLEVAPGTYQLVATLDADPAPAPVRRDVTVE